MCLLCSVARARSLERELPQFSGGLIRFEYLIKFETCGRRAGRPQCNANCPPGRLRGHSDPQTRPGCPGGATCQKHAVETSEKSMGYPQSMEEGARSILATAMQTFSPPFPPFPPLCIHFDCLEKFLGVELFKQTEGILPRVDRPTDRARESRAAAVRVHQLPWGASRYMMSTSEGVMVKRM